MIDSAIAKLKDPSVTLRFPVWFTTSVKLSGVKLPHVGTPARYFTVCHSEGISCGTDMRHVMLKRITSAAGAVSPCRFSGRQCIRSRLTTLTTSAFRPLVSMLSSGPYISQPHLPTQLPGQPHQPQLQPQPQPAPPTRQPASFHASQVTPPYRTKELAGLKGIQGMGTQSVAALKGIGISSKGELLYLHDVVCGGKKGATSTFVKVRS